MTSHYRRPIIVVWQAARPRCLTLVLLLGIASSAMPDPARGQGILDRIKAKAKEKTDAAADSLTTAAFDEVSGAMKCLVTNISCITKAFDAGKNVKLSDSKGNAVSAADSAKAVKAAGGVPAPLTEANAAAAASPPATVAPTSPPPTTDAPALINFDFVPGDKVLFAEDFSSDRVGDIPTRVKLLSGNFEVAGFKGQRFLRSTSGGRIMIPLRSKLPARFTLEFDAIHSWGWATDVHFADADHSDGLAFATFGATSGIGQFTSNPAEDKARQLYHARIMADGDHVKVYVDGKRVANVPEAKLGRANGIWIDGVGADDDPFYITNIRVAESDRALFDALSANGRVSTHGILFDTNRDAIRGESTPTLQEIGDMLKQHPDLKLTIEGHTDNVGTAAANQTLSEKRAAAVRQALITTYQVDGSRLTSKGYGATKPAVSNDTPEGRQQNRRVDLVKM